MLIQRGHNFKILVFFLNFQPALFSCRKANNQNSAIIWCGFWTGLYYSWETVGIPMLPASIQRTEVFSWIWNSFVKDIKVSSCLTLKRLNEANRIFPDNVLNYKELLMFDHFALTNDKFMWFNLLVAKFYWGLTTVRFLSKHVICFRHLCSISLRRVLLLLSIL